MTAKASTSSTTWAVISIACLVLGLAVGYVVFGHRSAPPVVTQVAPQQVPSSGSTPQAGLLDERAVQALRDILARDPKNVQAAIQLGNLYYDAGRYAEAVAPYQQALALDPSNVHVSTDLGTALHYSGRPDEALAQYEKSLAIDPNHAQTLFNQGIVRLDGKQDAPRAIQSWERLLAVNPEYPERARVQQLLEQTRQKMQATPVAPVRSTQ
ncbi:MAG TPA: tetratricopeptide repeat protein [Vicinamibacterales bacterium]|nr:tetratricopeptide repeat protein [Vicinamibacterales bacterium]